MYGIQLDTTRLVEKVSTPPKEIFIRWTPNLVLEFDGAPTLNGKIKVYGVQRRFIRLKPQGKF